MNVLSDLRPRLAGRWIRVLLSLSGCVTGREMGSLCRILLMYGVSVEETAQCVDLIL